MFRKMFLPIVATVISYLFGGMLFGSIVGVIALTYVIIQCMPNFYMMRGNAAYHKGDYDTCLASYEKAYQTGKMTPDNKVFYGYIALRCGDVDKAERMLSSAIQSKPNERILMQAKSNMALVLWKKGQLPEAISLMEGVFETYKTTAVYGSLGYFYILNGDMDQALSFNLEAYEYNSDDAVIMDNLGQIYYERKEYQKAKEMYEKVMEKAPQFPVPYYNYAMVELALGNKERAIELLHQALCYRFTYIAGVSEDQIRDKLEELETE